MSSADVSSRDSKKGDAKPAWATPKLRQTNAGRGGGRSLAALLEMDQSCSRQMSEQDYNKQMKGQQHTSKSPDQQFPAKRTETTDNKPTNVPQSEVVKLNDTVVVPSQTKTHVEKDQPMERAKLEGPGQVKPVFPIQSGNQQSPVRVFQKAEQVQPMKASVIAPVVSQNGRADSAVTSVKKTVEGGKATQLRPSTQSYVSKSPVIVHSKGSLVTTGKEEENKESETLRARETIAAAKSSSLRRAQATRTNGHEVAEVQAKKIEAAPVASNNANLFRSFNAQEPPKMKEAVIDAVSPKSQESRTSQSDEEVSALRREIEKLKAAKEQMERDYENQLREVRGQLQQAVRDSALSSTSSDGGDSPGLSASGSPVSPAPAAPAPTPPPPPPPPPPPSSNAAVPPPPPPPVPGGVPPPPPPLSGIKGAAQRKFRKPVVKPGVEMKQLFWTRYLLDNPGMDTNNNDRKKKMAPCIWEHMQEQDFEKKEFQKLFGRKVSKKKGSKKRQSLIEDHRFDQPKGRQVAKLLDNGRSQTIGIIMSSLSCQLEDIKEAVYKMDNSIIDMDGLKAVYDVRPKSEEIEMIAKHIQENPSVSLDKPEEFLLQLHKMDHFVERLECWLFKDKFEEVFYGMDRRLSAMCDASSQIRTNKDAERCLAIILTLGNLMNGGTSRGQADGFQLSVLRKLKDVKSQDNSMNLLQYVVQWYCLKTQDEGNGDYNLPDPYAILAAGQVSFKELRQELAQAKISLATCKAKAEIVLSQKNTEHRQPFEGFIKQFLAMGASEVERLEEKLRVTSEDFSQVTEYFRFTGEGEEVTPPLFFGIWGTFLEDFKNAWKLEKMNMVKRKHNNKQHLTAIIATASRFRQRRSSSVNKEETTSGTKKS